MKEKIGIRFLVQFLILCALRLVLLSGGYANMTLPVIFMLLIYAFIFTLCLESFDRFIVHYVRYRTYIILAIIITCILIMYFMHSIYLLVMIGYLSLVMIKDLCKLSSIQIALEDYQMEHEKEQK